jgi:hypothetical protein
LYLRVVVVSSEADRGVRRLAGLEVGASQMPPAQSPCSIGAVTTRLTVTVPQGINGGDLVRVAAPDGSYHSIMVPGGLASGQQFSVELLATSSSSAEVQKLRVRLWTV